MQYDEKTIMKGFELYKTLALNGVVEKSQLHEYIADDYVRGLVNRFAQEVDCVTLIVGDQLFMIPETKLSPFHVNNDFLKRTYLKTSATNADLYLLYFSTIVLIGEFYDSYHSKEPTRNFIGLDAWVIAVQKRVNALKEHSEEDLKALEGEFSYNWIAIIEKWEAMDDLKEQAKRQTGNTISRLSFLDTVKRFLIDQSLIEEIGNNEITISEKTKTIVQRYFMDLDYNRGILEFLYTLEADKKEATVDAINLED